MLQDKQYRKGYLAGYRTGCVSIADVVAVDGLNIYRRHAKGGNIVKLRTDNQKNRYPHEAASNKTVWEHY